jgi:hypothetical protein
MTRMEEFVGRFREQNPDFKPEDEIDLFLAWLQENGPDEWHRWAISWNWDHGTELFEWIIAQPNCDRGTVLSIYYASGVEYEAKYESLEEAKADYLSAETLPLVLKICEMWRGGAYQTYAYRPSYAATHILDQGKEAVLSLAKAVPWEVPDGLATAEISGEPNTFDGTIDGMPVEMLRAMGEEW